MADDFLQPRTPLWTTEDLGRITAAPVDSGSGGSTPDSGSAKSRMMEGGPIDCRGD
jgi:hypothetical protein